MAGAELEAADVVVVVAAVCAASAAAAAAGRPNWSSWRLPTPPAVVELRGGALLPAKPAPPAPRPRPRSASSTRWTTAFRLQQRRERERDAAELPFFCLAPMQSLPERFMTPQPPRAMHAPFRRHRPQSAPGGGGARGRRATAGTARGSGAAGVARTLKLGDTSATAFQQYVSDLRQRQRATELFHPLPSLVRRALNCGPALRQRSGPLHTV
eukprot:TRINITY_DN29763_c0_g1_i1.p2 TRINITY_DN29763_c0_g1~~TRINITY_DN29763_c0_g1_i1.p2  ORF type:complete len:226 (+),score=47.35 TRINITY_DN29763_c0_g1_i1:45-680(+)